MSNKKIIETIIANLLALIPVIVWSVFMYVITVEKDLPTGEWACACALSVLVLLVVSGSLRIFFIDVFD